MNLHIQSFLVLLLDDFTSNPSIRIASHLLTVKSINFWACFLLVLLNVQLMFSDSYVYSSSSMSRGYSRCFWEARSYIWRIGYMYQQCWHRQFHSIPRGSNWWHTFMEIHCWCELGCSYWLHSESGMLKIWLTFMVYSHTWLLLLDLLPWFVWHCWWGWYLLNTSWC